jgi:peptide/nickel transport system permease protein
MPELREPPTGDARAPANPSPGGNLTGPPAPLTGLAPPEEVEVEQAAGRKLGVLGWLSIVWLAVIFGAALLAPILPLDSPTRTVTRSQLEPFQEPGHILGADNLGRDMLSRVIWGARSSLSLAVGAVLVGTLVGGTLGLIAGYVRGWVDTVLSLLFNIVLAIPALVLAMSLVAVYANDERVSSERRLVVLILALGLVATPVLARITRGSTLSWSERDFVKAARAIGASPRRIMVREVLPNVLPATMSIALLFIAIVIVAEGSLAILGVGIEGEPSWGNIISVGRIHLDNAPHIVFVPAVAIFLTVMALNYLGDVLRARFDVRESVL